MAVSGLGKMAARATNVAAGAVGEIMGTGVYPESEYALAAYLFERIAAAEKAEAELAGEEILHDRAYHLELMATCLATVCGAAKKT
jgi:hypothetical protein